MKFKIDTPNFQYTMTHNECIDRLESGTFVECCNNNIYLVIRDVSGEDALLRINTSRPCVVHKNNGERYRVLDEYDTLTIGKSKSES